MALARQRQRAASNVVAFVRGAPDDLRASVASVARPLLAQEDGAVLLETVECFLRANGSRSAVARVLYVHRNTVGYRLQRVEDLCGCGLTSTADRVVWAVALLALGRATLLEPMPAAAISGPRLAER